MNDRISTELRPPQGTTPRKLVPWDLLRAISRHRGKAVAVFIAIVLSVLVGTRFLTRTYHSEAKLLVRLGREDTTLDPTSAPGQGSMVVGSMSRDNEINSVAEILHSRGIIEKVVDAVGPAAILRPPVATNAGHGVATPSASQEGWIRALRNGLGRIISPFPPLSDREEAISRLITKIRVEPIRKSNVVTITYEGYGPETAQAIVAKLVECYLEQHAQLNHTQGAHDFLAEQTERLQSGLVRSERELRDVMNADGIVSCDGQRESLVKERNLLETELRDATAAAAGSQAQVDGLKAAIRQLPKMQVAEATSGIGDYGTDLMRGQLYTLQLREHELSAKYTDRYPELREIHEQVGAAKSTLDQENRTRRQVSEHPAHAYEESQITLVRETALLASWQAKREALGQQVAEVRAEMKAFNDVDLRYRKLRREIDLKDAKYRRYSENLDQARIDEALEMQRMSNISVAQAATCEPPPVYPKPTLNFLLGLGLGLSGALATAIGADYREMTAEDRKKLARRDAPGVPAMARA